MSELRDQGQLFDLLDRTLDTFGADAARWPMGTQAALASFIAGNTDARRRVADAEALDAVLGFAPTLSVERQAALVDAIVAKAGRQPRAAVVSDRAVHRPQGPLSGARPNSWRQNSWGTRSLTAGALAASLMLGVLAGQNTTLGSLTDAMLNGGDATATGSQQVAQSDEIGTVWEEDLL